MKQNKPGFNPALKFVIKFLCLFALFYGFYILFLAITSHEGKLYSPFLDEHLNFISWLRYTLIESSAGILNLLGYQTKTTTYQMLVVGHNIIHVGYDCLGFGVMCFFSAFVIAYPGVLKVKLYFFIPGLVCIQLLNLSRFILLALYWRHTTVYISDHHTIFNIVTYLIIAISLYFYTRYQDRAVNQATL
ncbi:hypothetical protein EWM62_06595 [Mucilaginibacter terrigena]|uniref:Exosortase/archaeosortase family protein n=1 Tax=Mucilaginibacter terrigena TaxID=2492395 RepID=A0A4Q5LQI4_9SPHI|nr:hypothetical protein [Mucilaginibacter terrigena]RYU91603.1 hypothetical protein EWM62_06595 [Mucilaginibacter terrigena]